MNLFSSMAMVAAIAGTASAGSVFLLDFEGLGDQDTILDFYNGGMSSQGNSGPDFGVEFVGNTLSIIDADAGGTGNFGNEPSPDTIMFFLSGGATTMNVAAGFNTGFGLQYTSVNESGIVEIYAGLNGTGALLGSLNLVPLGAGAGDPNGTFSNWAHVGVDFMGLAHSVVFGGVADQIGFDDVTFGTSVNVVPLPPAAFAGLGLLGVMSAYRRIRR